MTTNELMAACREAWIAEGLSDKTINAYLLVVRRAEVALNKSNSSIATATARQIRALDSDWRHTRSSKMQLRTALVRTWKVLERLDAPAGAIRVPTKPRYRSKALDEPTAAVLASAAKADPSPAGLAVLIGLYGGLRREEIASLRWDNLRDGWLEFIGKRDVTRQVPIHPDLIARLKLAQRESTSLFLFPGRIDGHVTPTTIWIWSRKLSFEALDKLVPPHVLRHTAITTLNDKTGDLRAAQEFAGHLSPETTVIYTRVTRDRLIAAVAQINYGGANGKRRAGTKSRVDTRALGARGHDDRGAQDSCVA